MMKEFQILRKLKQLIAPLKRSAYLRRMARAGLLALACILVLLTVKMHFIPSEKGKVSYLEQADLFYENGAYGQARIMYKDVLENPSWSAQEKEWAHYQLGNCYRKLGSLPQAICYYETFIRQYPKSRYLPEVKYGLALCYEKAENQDRRKNGNRVQLAHAISLQDRSSSSSGDAPSPGGNHRPIVRGPTRPCQSSITASK